MPCYHPLTVWAIDNPETGKKAISFNLAKRHDPNYEEMKLPCGQCLGCRLEYSRQWAMRCVLEAKSWSNNYFVTLTYDEEHVPLRDHFKVDTETGEVVDAETVMTLVPNELTLFMKRLRTNFQREYGHVGIRFFGCGEYGDQNKRPHYHIILFNCPFEDLCYDHAANGYTYYRSPLLEKTWTKGMSIVTDFSFRTAAYVARYMLKKHKGFDRDWYTEHGVEPEFTRCSRRPGIGYEYFAAHKDEMYKYDSLVVPISREKALRCSPPKFFDRKFEEFDLEALKVLKERRKARAMQSMSQQLSNTDLGPIEYLEVCEGNKAFSASHLIRPL